MSWLERLLEALLPKKKVVVTTAVLLLPLFKTERDGHEYTELMHQNRDLYDISQDILTYSQTNFNVTPTITMIYRYQAEQDSLYKDNKSYKESKFKSPHQFWQALDYRNTVYTQQQLIQLLEYVNTKYNPTNYYSWTMKCHEVSSNGMHLHLQYVRKK